MMPPLTRAETQSMIVQRTWKDDAFRSEFIAPIAMGGTALSTAIAGAGAGTKSNHGW